MKPRTTPSLPSLAHSKIPNPKQENKIDSEHNDLNHSKTDLLMRLIKSYEANYKDEDIGEEGIQAVKKENGSKQENFGHLGKTTVLKEFEFEELYEIPGRNKQPTYSNISTARPSFLKSTNTNTPQPRNNQYLPLLGSNNTIRNINNIISNTTTNKNNNNNNNNNNNSNNSNNTNNSNKANGFNNQKNVPSYLQNNPTITISENGQQMVKEIEPNQNEMESTMIFPPSPTPSPTNEILSPTAIDVSKTRKLTKRNNSAKRIPLRLPPLLLPPIYTVQPRPLKEREFLSPTRLPGPITDEQWEDLFQCRYLRHITSRNPFKIHTH